MILRGNHNYELKDSGTFFQVMPHYIHECSTFETMQSEQLGGGEQTPYNYYSINRKNVM